MSRRGRSAGSADSLTGATRVALGSLSAGAAVVHFAVSPEHFGVGFLFGAFFAVVATLQLGWGAAIVTRPTRPLYVGGAIGNALVLGVWALSRTTGIPFGPEAGVAEPIGTADALASLYEVVIAGGSLYLAAGGEPAEGLTRVRFGWPTAVAVYLLPALAVGFGGHGHADSVAAEAGGHLLAHHFFHLVFIGGASLVFVVYVAFLILENGWPKFSWRIDPPWSE